MPILMTLIFKFLQHVYADTSMHICEVVDPTAQGVIAFRGDARASGDTVGMGA